MCYVVARVSPAQLLLPNMSRVQYIKKQLILFSTSWFRTRAADSSPSRLCSPMANTRCYWRPNSWTTSSLQRKFAHETGATPQVVRAPQQLDNVVITSGSCARDGSYAVVVWNVDFGAFVDQDAHYLCTPMVSSAPDGSLAVVVYTVDVGAFVDQDAHYICIPRASSNADWSMAVVVSTVDVGAFVDQDAHYICIPRASSNADWSRATVLTASIDVGAVDDQEIDTGIGTLGPVFCQRKSGDTIRVLYSPDLDGLEWKEGTLDLY